MPETSSYARRSLFRDAVRDSSGGLTFVMSSEREIIEAIEDYQSGRLGEIAR